MEEAKETILYSKMTGTCALLAPEPAFDLILSSSPITPTLSDQSVVTPTQKKNIFGKLFRELGMRVRHKRVKKGGMLALILASQRA